MLNSFYDTTFSFLARKENVLAEQKVLRGLAKSWVLQGDEKKRTRGAFLA